MNEYLDQLALDIWWLICWPDPPPDLLIDGRWFFYGPVILAIILAVGWVRGWQVYFMRFVEIGFFHIEKERARAIRRKSILEDLKQQAATGETLYIEKTEEAEEELKDGLWDVFQVD